MDSDLSSLIIVDEKDSFLAPLGDPLPHVPPLRWWSETDALVPFPDSLDQIDDLHGFISMSDNSAAMVPYQHHSPPPLNELALGNINLDSFTRDNIHGFISMSDNSAAMVRYQHLFPPPLNELALGNINLDFFTRDNKLTPYHGDVISDIAPLNIIASTSNGVYGKSNYNYPFEVSKVDQIEGRSIERRTNGRQRLTDIGFDEIKNYFYMPITRAAKEMNVGVTVLKMRCRELGILRWPHRKMKSLTTLIHNVQKLGKVEESMRRELERLEEQRRLMEENPEMEFSERTKKLRQACFKANYKRRKALRNPCVDRRNRYYA